MRSTTDYWRDRFEGALPAWKRQREEAIAEFRASGGECIYCQDHGFCERCERGRAEIADEEARDRLRWLDRCGLPPRCRRYSFGSFPDQRNPTLERVVAFVDGWDAQRGLLVMGKYGIGKTGLMAAAINALCPKMVTFGQSARFLSTSSLFDGLREGYDNGQFAEIMRDCQRTDLLILDDLGVEKPTEWVRERLFAIINYRYEQEKPTWATTNLTPQELERACGERVVWRLMETCDVIAATGRNLRER